MLLATWADGRVEPPERTGDRATCPGCGARVDAVVGEIVIPHWRHHAIQDCDSWAGGETLWHLEWKSRAYAAGWRIEVGYPGPPIHRADAVSLRGHVVEFQHSSLSVDDLAERTDFYAGKGPLVWVLDATGSSWRKRWHKWKKTGTDLRALLILDEGEGVPMWALNAIDGRVFRISRLQMFEKMTQREAMKIHSVSIPCWTCGVLPDHFFHDGSPAYPCSGTHSLAMAQ